ncbi:MAG: 50S ribosomal protein L13 [candidate division WOR-3 bacterium]|jgi:large subunit ribosomal protein L13|nr:50S ribosomal protein L13 [candidate division WOR-3 bacterium]MDH7518303.1 50S ribosomal protein L13 [bacterium]
MKTSTAKKSEMKGEWYLIDANEQVLGRLATRIARLLMGKHRPNYTPHVDAGDHVVVINAQGIRVTGNKSEQKIYYRHSTLPGKLKMRTYRETIARFPTRPLQLAVLRMLPKNRLQAKRIRRLHIYVGAEHPHQAQKLIPVDIE